MYQSLKKRLKIEIEEIKDSGRYKNERIITSPQKAIINANEDEVVNFCANNYLGLASDERIIDAAIMDNEKGLKNKYTGKVVSPYDFFSEQEVEMIMNYNVETGQEGQEGNPNVTVIDGYTIELSE